MARELKPISFNPDNKADKEILEYIEELGISFGSYVKLLIRKDMRAGGSVVSEINETNDTREIASQLKELVSVLKAGNISIGSAVVNETDKETYNEIVATVATDEPEETEEEKAQRLAMQGLLGMGGI